MGTYKGNEGNLMQHWTLCELLAVAGRHTSGLNFIDAHAMAPHACTRTGTASKFDRVRAGLENHVGSAYEQAWRDLGPSRGYPNSAAFVEKVWEGDFSLSLCETKPTTIVEIDTWLECIGELARCKNATLFRSDWRKRFDEGLPTPSTVGLASGALTLLSFDPYMYNGRRRFADRKKRNGGNLYPDDIDRALNGMSCLNGGILLQLSTYSTNDNNPQGAVISSVNAMMTAQAFTLCGVVRVNNNMMSLIYARSVPWSSELADLPDRFAQWFEAIPD